MEGNTEDLCTVRMQEIHTENARDVDGMAIVSRSMTRNACDSRVACLLQHRVVCIAHLRVPGPCRRNHLVHQVCHGLGALHLGTQLLQVRRQQLGVIRRVE